MQVRNKIWYAAQSSWSDMHKSRTFFSLTPRVPLCMLKSFFFSHFSWLVQWISPKRRDCLLSIMMGVTIYCMHFWLWFCKECFVGLYACICLHDTLTTRQLGCGCLGQEEHLSINLCQWGFDPVINRENVEQFYRI